MMRKIISIVLAVAVVLCIMPFGVFASPSAETEFYSIKLNGATLYYYVENDEVELYSCDKWINGDVILPSELDGYPITSLRYLLFENCNLITSIVIPEGIKSIGSSTFYGCSSLKSVKFFGSVTSIGKQAFMYCSSLKTITIPESVKTIDDYAFASCESLESIKIPNNVTDIGENAFKYCKSLKTVSIPSSVTSIGDSAFEGCSNIETVFYLGTTAKLGIILKDNNECLITAKSIYYHNYHQFDEWTVSLEPTCKDMGGKYHTCNICGEVEKELILPTGIHTYKNGECIHCGEIRVIDVNSDGSLDSADVVLIKKAILGKTEVSRQDTVYYDINEDKNINILDLISLKKLLTV